LRSFLAEHEIDVTASMSMGLRKRIWTLNHEQVADAARQIDIRGADALYIACTNVTTYDLIKPLQKELGLPVLSANQTTIAAALRLAGVEPSEHTQLPTPPAVLPLREDEPVSEAPSFDYPER